jgi:hypothetical protein
MIAQYKAAATGPEKDQLKLEIGFLGMHIKVHWFRG